MTRPKLFVRMLLSTVALASLPPVSAGQQGTGPMLHPMDKTTQVAAQSGQLLLREALQFVNIPDARTRFRVTGKDLTVAVLDTGLNVAHADFRNAIKAFKNFSTDDQAAVDVITDREGHGTNVTGIIMANGPKRVDPANPEEVNVQVHPAGLHKGIAIDASVVALKVMPSPTWKSVEDALQWVLDNYQTHAITVVNMSIQSPQNLQDDTDPNVASMKDAIGKLLKLHIPVVVSAGNGFVAANSVQGMAVPAIIRETISVAAVYDADISDPAELPKTYRDWNGEEAIARKVKQGQLAPFSQRLVATDFQTDLAAPGAVIFSSGQGNLGESRGEGTSQAAPVVSGLILLLQDGYREWRISKEAGGSNGLAAQLRASAINDIRFRPSVQQLLRWLRNGVEVNDNYGDDDNVTNTLGKFIRIDALRAFEAMTAELKKIP